MNAPLADSLPQWFDAFGDSPVEAIDDLLFERASLGRWQGGDPADALLDWARGLPESEGFPARLDEALAEWLSKNFDTPPRTGAGRWADAFSRAFMVTAELQLSAAAQTLHGDIEGWRHYLRAFYDGPPQDPEGWYLRALAANQTDRSLLGLWYRTCRLEPHLPPHFGFVGTLGLRWLPDEHGEAPGDINPELGRGLLLLGQALASRGAKHEDEFKRVLRLTTAAYPRGPEVWASILEPAEGAGAVKTWVMNAIPGVMRLWMKSAITHQRSLRAAPSQMQGWAQRARSIAAGLSSESWRKHVASAKALLAEQRAHAYATGAAEFFVRSACNFAGCLCVADADRALKWVEEAHDWAPYNAYTYTQRAKILLEKGDLAGAESILWCAVQRFPDDVVAHTSLALVLKAQRRFDEAEAKYREAKRQFPDDAYARTGLAEVLRVQGRLQEAEFEYRQAIMRFPDNRYVREHQDAIAAQSPITQQDRVGSGWDSSASFGENHVARTGLGHLLRRMARRAEQAGRVDEAARRRCEAHELFDSVLELRAHDSYALAGRGFLFLDEHRADEALKLFQDAERRFPGLDVFAYGVMRALRAKKQSPPDSLWERLRSGAGDLGVVLDIEQAQIALARGDTVSTDRHLRAFRTATRQASASHGSGARKWYVESIRRIVCDDASADTGPGLAAMRARLASDAADIDDVTEQYVTRLAA